MGNIVVICNLTLDGVMQAPAVPMRTPATGSPAAGGRCRTARTRWVG